jgi:precorrin-2/cobalt-factor-2 C20-methyltransferase
MSYPTRVRKTSVYLPDHLKRALEARAAATSRSEAEVVRAAVEAEVAATGRAPAGPAAEAPRPGRLVGVGVGPGDPELITVKALRALRRADRVLAPATAADAVGRAETIVREAAADVRVQRVAFAMHPDVDERARAMAAVAETVVGYLAEGEEVAFITLGDPLTYSTFSPLAGAVQELRPATEVEVVPGIMAFQSLAARTQTTLVDERQRLSIRTALDAEDAEAGGEDLRDPDCTVVVYKGGRHLPVLATAAKEAERLDRAVAGELLGMSGERIGHLAELAETGPAGYLATVILPARPAVETSPRRSRSNRSRAGTGTGRKR